MLENRGGAGVVEIATWFLERMHSSPWETWIGAQHQNVL